MSDSLYFEVLSGEILDLAKQHVADRVASVQRNKALLDELGCVEYFPSILDGTIVCVKFPGAPHLDFTKPTRTGATRPKRGTDWAKRFEAQQGYDKCGQALAERLGVPTSISYEYEGGSGSRSLSGGFHSGVGFLYLSAGGPFALYVPDVAQRVTEYEAKGYTVNVACKNFKPEFSGCRRILKQEWEFAVAKLELDEARKEQAA